MLQKIIDSVKQFEEAYRIDDISALKSLYDAVNMCVSISKSIANNGSLNDLANSKRQIMVSLFKTTEYKEISKKKLILSYFEIPCSGRS